MPMPPARLLPLLKDTLRRHQEQLRIVDSLFADWLKTRFGTPL